MPSQSWIAHAYPLQQITVQLQGTKHSNKTDIICQLETVLARLRAGDLMGEDHDDDYGMDTALLLKARVRDRPFSTSQ